VQTHAHALLADVWCISSQSSTPLAMVMEISEEHPANNGPKI